MSELDVSLGLLDLPQIQASDQYEGMVSKAQPQKPDNLPLWVPIAQLPSTSSSPVEVHDGDGRQLPRLTQYESSRLIAAGLYRLFRLLLENQAERQVESDANLLLHRVDEARWLVESAIYALLTGRGRPAERLELRRATPGTRRGASADLKEFALGTLNACRSDLSGFFALLEVASKNYIIIVGLDRRQDEQVLRYESPTIVETSFADGRLQAFSRRNLTAYRVDYEAQLPATLRAYHLVVETDPDVSIETVYLKTDSEIHIAKQIASDLEGVAQLISGDEISKGRKFLEIEAQTVLRACSEIVRRREWEAELGMQILDDERTRHVGDIGWIISSGEARDLNGQLLASVLRHPVVTADNLRLAAAELTNNQMGYTLSCAADPPGSSSHVYWRRNAELRAKDGPIKLDARIVLRDASENRPTRLRLYAAAMSLMTWIVASILAQGLWPFQLVNGTPSQTDALVAVLLLVPGLLYSRMDLGRRGSIAAQLRGSSQAVGLSTIATSALTAAVIAGEGPPWLLNMTLSAAIVLPVAAGFLLVRQTRDVDGTSGLSEVDPAPWIATSGGETAQVDVRVKSVDASVEGLSNE